jgi:two-component sensor histidine kinase
MALHELATNASKYGALSDGSGRVRISWQVIDQPSPIFTMCWLEEGGPKVAVPSRQGFGQVVTGRMVESALDGAVDIEFRESGLVWKLTAPVSDTLEKGTK